MATKDEIAHLDEFGYIVLKGVLATNQAAKLRSRTDELMKEERAAGKNIDLNGKAQRVWNLVNKGRIYEEMIQLPQVLEFQEYLLGDDCTLSSFSANLIGPGAPSTDLHVDGPMRSFPKPLPSSAFCANTMYVLDDFTTDNGATLIVPKSFSRGYYPDPSREYDDVIQLAACKGDIVIFHGTLWHASGANRTKQGRMILLGFFCRWFIKPMEDNIQLARPEVIDRATPTLKRLLGFDSQPSVAG